MDALNKNGREANMVLRASALLVFATLILSAPLVQAVPITIEITGEVTGGYGSLWGGSIYEGAFFAGIYTYDSSTLDTSDWSEIGLYVHDSPYGLNVSLGGFEFQTVPNHTGQFTIKITDDGPNLDSYEVLSDMNKDLSNGAYVDYVLWGLHGPSSMLFSTALPVDAPVVSQWPDKYMHIHGTDVYGNAFHIDGTITQAVLVPEPSSVILMIIGISLYRRKR